MFYKAIIPFSVYFSLAFAQLDERTVTDLEIIYGSHGVEVSYQYNETSNAFGSVPGCPKSIDGFPWIYYGNPPRCFLAYHNGPCPLGQKLVLQQRSPYGVCACDCLADEDGSNKLISLDRYVFCNRFSFDAPHGKIYDKAEQNCYRVFKEQGPCNKKDEVITEHSGTSITCNTICNNADQNLELKIRKGDCVREPFVGYGVAASVFRNDDCPDHQTFSEILRKCVRKSGSGGSPVG